MDPHLFLIFQSSTWVNLLSSYHSWCTNRSFSPHFFFSYFFHLIPQSLFFIIWLIGDFVPNAISEYDNAHRRLDSFRCNIPNSEAAYRDLVRSDHEMTVEILNVDKVMILFTIPWATRVQGKYLTRPDSVRDTTHSKESSQAPLGSSLNPRASVFDPWMGFNNSSPGVWKREKLIMCVSDIEKAPSRKVRCIWCHKRLN